MAVRARHPTSSPLTPGRPGDEDDRLIAAASAPPTVEEARETLVFWERRLAGLSFLDRSARREAQAAVVRASEQLRAAERAAYGPSALEQLLNLLGIRRLPGRELLSVVKKALILLTVLFVALIVASIVFWPDIYPVLRDLSQLGGGGGG